MTLVDEKNERWNFFHKITGDAMKVYNKFHAGLLESAYEAGLKFLLERDGYKVEEQVYVPMFWDDIRLEQSYRIDLLVNDDIIIELKTAKFIGTEHRRQLWNYMNLTHKPYGMLINFTEEGLYSEWYYRDPETEKIDKIKINKRAKDL